MSKQLFLWAILLCSISSLGQKKITIKFEHIANSKKIVLNDSTYKNNGGEKYNINKLKYYVSNISFMMDKKFDTHHEVYLIEVSKTDSIIIASKQGKIWGIYFTIGIDSTLNCSGAQSGVLDPLNNMFWTWNNGYVFFKLEGTSPSSTADKNRIEHHIGGYKGAYKTQRRIYLPIKKVSNTITIQMDLDKYWNNIKIAEIPVIAAPSRQAKMIADNFVAMFTMKE